MKTQTLNRMLRATLMIAYGAYSPEEWVQLRTKYLVTKVVNESLAPGRDDINRLQVDVLVKF